jgi:hypothetical protein
MGGEAISIRIHSIEWKSKEPTINKVNWSLCECFCRQCHRSQHPHGQAHICFFSCLWKPISLWKKSMIPPIF